MSRYVARPMEPGNTNDANIHVVTWGEPQAEAAGMARAIVANYRQNPRSEDPTNTHLVMVTRRQFGFMLGTGWWKRTDLSVDLSFSESLLETW